MKKITSLPVTSGRKKFYQSWMLGILVLLLFQSPQLFALGVPEGTKSLTSQNNNEQILKGKVVDEKGQALPSVSVVIKGTTTGTLSDVDGNYSLEIPDGNVTIVYAYLGFISQEIVPENKTSINITLKEDTKLLDEVVVVGYGTQKKTNLTGAVGMTDAKTIESRPISNLGAGLQGSIPGLEVKAGAKPGADASFNIRGITNLTGAGPLILVDGVQMSPNMINPNDVKSVTVLKDAASASIYGARAAYGVILITTKTGVNQKPVITFTSNLSINTPTAHPTMMTGLQYANWMNDMAKNMNWSAPMYNAEDMAHIEAYAKDPKNNLPVYRDPNNPTYYRYAGNTDWYKALNKPSYPMQQYNTSIAGGTKDVKYYASLGYMDQKGLARYVDEDYNRINLMQNVTYNLASWIQVGLRTTLNATQNTGALDLGDGQGSLDIVVPEDARPTMPVYYPDGNFTGEGVNDGTGQWSATNNAQKMQDGGYQSTKANDLWATGTLKLTPLEGLVLNADYTYNYYTSNNKQTSLLYTRYKADGIPVGQSSGGMDPINKRNNNSAITYQQNNDTYKALNVYGSYEKTIQEKNYFKIMVGFNQEEKTFTNFSAGKLDLITDNIPYINGATGSKYVADGINDWAIRGAFTRLNYSYDNRYLVEVNGRYDGSSRFPTADRFAFFPSVSLGWKMSNEKFWKPLAGVVNDFKLRGSYGKLGNQVTADNNGATYYPYISTYGSGQTDYLFGGATQSYVNAPGLVSANLTWETVNQINGGFDFGMFDNHLTGSLDIYQRNTKNMLAPSTPLPAVIATGEPLSNAADLKTNGWEASINWKGSLHNGLVYGASFVMSDYQSVITRFTNPTNTLVDENGKTVHYAGQKLGEIWGFQTAGIFQSDAEAAAWDQSQVIGFTTGAGDIKIASIDKNGKQGVITTGQKTVGDHGDLKVIGNTTPHYSYGFRANAAWKGFDLSLFFQGVMKRDVMPSASFYLTQYHNQWKVPSAMGADYWTPENTNALFPRPRNNGWDEVISASDEIKNQSRFMLNGAYLRLKQLTFGYTIPEDITMRAKISKLRIYFAGNNLLDFSQMPSGFDPETTSMVGYPMYRSYSLGLNLSF